MIGVRHKLCAAGLMALLLAACSGGGSNSAGGSTATAGGSTAGYQVGLNPADPNLPAAPVAPSGATAVSAYGAATYGMATAYSGPAGTTTTQNPPVTTCKIPANYFSSGSPAIPTLTANGTENVDQALAANWTGPSPIVPGMSSKVNMNGNGLNVPDGYPTAPDTNRIQAALFACANANSAYDSNNDIASNGVVELTAGTGGQTAFVSGPLSMPGGVTLLIDKGITLFASRDPVLYESATTGAPTGTYYGTPTTASTGAMLSTAPNPSTVATGTYYCGQISPNDDGCNPLISNLVYTGTSLKPSTIQTSNNAVMGPGTIDGQGGQPLYSLMAGKAMAVGSGSSATTWTPPSLIMRPTGNVAMSWWDLGWEGNEALSGEDQNNPRLIYPQYGYNFTLFNLTLQNAPKIHVSPAAIPGFTAWSLRIFTPTKAYQSMTNYWGANYDYGSVKNTDGFDPELKGSKSSLTTPVAPAFVPAAGAPYPSSPYIGDMSNIVLAYSYISDSDDNIAVKGESGNPTSIANDGALYNMTVAHDHFFYGHGMSIGSQTSGGTAVGKNSAGVLANTTPLYYTATNTSGNALLYPAVSNINVYDLVLDYTDNGVRIKTNWSEGGLVSNINYTNICLQANPSPSPEDTAPQSPIYIYPYYSATSDTGLYPSYQNITVNGMHDVGYPGGGTGPGNGPLTFYFEGFNSGSSQMSGSGWGSPLAANVVNPLGLTLNNVVSDTPGTVSASVANIALGSNVSLNSTAPLASSTANSVTVTQNAPAVGTATVDCSQAFANIPGNTDANGTAINSPFPGQQFP